MLANQIAELNNKIVTAQSNGQPANDLSDQRDLLLDQITSSPAARWCSTPTAASPSTPAARMILDDTTVKPLEMYDGQPPEVRYANSTTAIHGIGGTLGAQARHLGDADSDGDVEARRARRRSRAVGERDSLRRARRSAAIRRSPRRPETSSTSRCRRRPVAIRGSPRSAFGSRRRSPVANDVAASGPGATGPGNNDARRWRSRIFATTARHAHVARPARRPRRSAISSTRPSADLRPTRSRRRMKRPSRRRSRRTRTTPAASVSGVSTDEELIAIIQHQHAYQAAARLVSVVNDMMDALVDDRANRLSSDADPRAESRRHHPDRRRHSRRRAGVRPQGRPSRHRGPGRRAHSARRDRHRHRRRESAGRRGVARAVRSGCRSSAVRGATSLERRQLERRDARLRAPPFRRTIRPAARRSALRRTPGYRSPAATQRETRSAPTARPTPSRRGHSCSRRLAMRLASCRSIVSTRTSAQRSTRTGSTYRVGTIVT